MNAAPGLGLSTNVPAEETDSDHAFMHSKERCRELIVANRYRTVCEVGGGRSPLFDGREVDELGIKYTVLDISQSELDLAPSGYTKVCRDIAAVNQPDHYERYDFVMSHMLAEHVNDGALMHRNLFSLINPGGRAFHMFPTLFSPPFVINRLLPEAVTSRALAILKPDRSLEPKFPALYSNCRGPTVKMHRFFTDMGYEVEEYRPFYGHGYFQHIPLVRQVDARFSRAMARHRNPVFTSFVWLTLRKP